MLVLNIEHDCCCYCYDYRSRREDIPLGSALADTTLELRDIDVKTGVAQLWIGQQLACFGLHQLFTIYLVSYKMHLLSVQCTA